MGRNYPRFLISSSYSVKSPGIFIQHTLEPRISCKVHLGMLPDSKVDSDNYHQLYNYFALELLRPMPEDANGNRYGILVRTALDDMARWYHSKLTEETEIDCFDKLNSEVKSILGPFISLLNDEFVQFSFNTREYFEMFKVLLTRLFKNRDTVFYDNGSLIIRCHFVKNS